jgi:hypothetical protein
VFERRQQRIGMWILVAMLSVISLVLYVDNKRTRNCIAEYMVKDQQNTAQRAELLDQERLQFLQTMQVVFDPNQTPERRRDAGEAYINLVLENNKKRDAAPVLKVPTECD